MEGTYPVRYRGETVGSVILRRTGLYYELHCRCQLTGEEMLQLVLVGNSRSQNIGLLIPQNGGLALTKRIPAKRLEEGSPVFGLRKRGEADAPFFAIDPEQPFRHLSRLEDCVFALCNGAAGVELRNEKSAEKVEI